MIEFDRKRTKPKNVRYKVDEYVGGRMDYVTDCPYGEIGRYTNRIKKVGDLECNKCKWQVKNDTDNRIVKCMYTEEEKPLFKIL